MILIKKRTAFTLVELIIVITILAILATIAFVSFQSYTKDARDSNRLSTLKNIESGLQAFQINTGNYPEVENYTLIQASGTSIGYQGYIGGNVAKLIKINTLPLDPLDKEKYIYSTNHNKTKFQLLGLLETNNQTAYIEPTFAADYTKRVPKSFGNSLGIFLNTDNSPISGTGIDIVKTNTPFKAIINNSINGVFIGTGEKLTNNANKYWRWIYNYTGSSDIYYTTGCSGPNDNGSFISQIYIR